jgi:hypothetical protein
MSEIDLDIRDKVREHYASVAERKSSCCSDNSSSCDCSVSEQIGYSAEDLAPLPKELREPNIVCGAQNRRSRC